MKNYTFDYKLLNEDHQQKNQFIGRLQSSVAFISKYVIANLSKSTNKYAFLYEIVVDFLILLE